MKLARKSFGDPYKCKQNWEEDTFVQCGDKGVVFSKKGGYTVEHACKTFTNQCVS